jgi:hypothetical protein
MQIAQQTALDRGSVGLDACQNTYFHRFFKHKCGYFLIYICAHILQQIFNYLILILNLIYMYYIMQISEHR